MLKLSKVAITGGISCGKSAFCRFLQEFGAYCVSADKIVHQLLSPRTTLGQKVVQLLGPEIVQGGKIDRQRVAAKVFSHPELLEKLEELIHPAVFGEIERLYKDAGTKENVPLFVAEIPLLYEVGAEDCFDFIIGVFSDEQLAFQRFHESTGYEKDEFAKRKKRQLSNKEKAAQADYIVWNNGSLDELREKAKQIFFQIVGDRLPNCE
jgi:dephospho-CoA kinase